MKPEISGVICAVDRILASPGWAGAGRRRFRRLAVVFLAALAGGFTFSAVSAVGGGPEMTAAVTRDLTGNGLIDAIEITFDQPMDSSRAPQVNDGGFQVEGYVVSAASWVSAASGLPVTQLRLTLAEIPGPGDTGATPKVTYRQPADPPAKSGSDLGGQEVADGAETSPTDLAGPVLMAAVGDDYLDYLTVNLFNYVADELQVFFSEPVRLVGATALDRHVSLEQALKFQATPGIPVPIVDGDGVTKHNLPLQGSGADPVVAPADATGTANPVVVRMLPGNHPSTNPFTSALGATQVGISADERANERVRDAAGNPVAPQTPATKRTVVTADTKFFSVQTQDVDGNGGLDALRVTVTHALDDSTLTAEQLGRFAIELGQTSVVPSAIGTGGAAGDETFVLSFTPPEVWGTSLTPTLSYQRPADPADPTKCPGGIQAGTPAGTRSCLALHSDAASIDRAAPALLEAGTEDADANGKLDRVTLRFSEAVVGTTAGWTVGGAPATGFQVSADDATVAQVLFAEGAAPDTDAAPPIAYDPDAPEAFTGDAAGAELPPTTRVPVDGAKPVMVEATTLDDEANGTVERVTIEFSEPVKDASASPGEFRVGGTDAASGRSGTAFGSSAIDPAAANDSRLTVLVDDLAGTGPQRVEYVPGGTLVDLAEPIGNPAPAQTIQPTDPLSVDGARPVGTLSSTPASPVTATTVTVRATFTEQMDTAVAPTVTLGGKPVTPKADIDHTNGWLTQQGSPNIGKIWEGTVTIEEADCAVDTGCAVTLSFSGAKDPAGNATSVEPLTAEYVIDTIAPPAPTGEAPTAIVDPGRSAGAGYLNMFTSNLTVAAAIEAGKAAGGTAQLLVDGAPLTPAAGDATIGTADTSVTMTTAFANKGALRAVFTEGAHTISVKLCDGAGNCTTSAGASVTADYTPIAITLVSPNGGTYRPGDTIPVTWDGDQVASDLGHVFLRYSTDDGLTFDGVISASESAPDGTVSWTAPRIDSIRVRVQAGSVDAAGNVAADASDNRITIQVPGDGPPDGVAEPGVLRWDAAGGLASLDTWRSTRSAFTTRFGDWTSTGYDASKVAFVVSGDFNRDGATDVSAFYRESTFGGRLQTWLEAGKAFSFGGDWWTTSGYNADSVLGYVSGDFNRDGRDDIAAMYRYSAFSTRFHVWLSTGSRFVYQGSTGWWSSTGYLTDRVVGLVAADVNGDGMDDLVAMYRYGTFSTRFHVWLSTGRGFTYQSSIGWWSSTGYASDKVVELVAGDLDANGREDLVALYDYGVGGSRLHVWLSNGRRFSYAGSTGWWASSTFPAASVRQIVADDVTGDRRADVVVLRDLGSAVSLETWRSTGRAFSGPARWWSKDGYALDTVRDLFSGDFGSPP